MRFDLGLELWKLIACEIIAGGKPAERKRLLKNWVDSGDADPRLMQAEAMLTFGVNGRTLAELYGSGPAEFHQQVSKAAVAAGTTTDATWASPLVALQTLVNAALLNLAPWSAFDFIAQHALPIPAGVRVPYESGTNIPAGVVAEGAAIPVRKAAFTSSAFMTPVKVGDIIGVTDELRRFSANGAAAYLSQLLGRAIGRATDAKLVSILTNGIAPLADMGGNMANIQALFAAVPLGSGSRPVILGAPSLLVQMALERDAGGQVFPDLAVMGGGSIGGVPVQPTDALESGTSPNESGLLLVDCSRLMIDSGTLEVVASGQTSLQMTDAPSGGAASMVSMYNTNTIATRAVRYFAAERPIADSVAWVQEA